MGCKGFFNLCLVLGLGFIGGVWGLDCKKDDHFTIESAKDLGELNKCKAFKGSVTVTADAPKDIKIDGPRTIGSINITDVENLRSISSKSIEDIRDITIVRLPNLEAIGFSALNVSATEGVVSTLWLEDLPSLENCSFGQGPSNAIVVSNTSLQNLDWLTWPVTLWMNITSNYNLETFKIGYETVGSIINLSDNVELKDIDVTAVKNITRGFSMSNNGVEELIFESLETIDATFNLNGTFKKVEMPALKEIEEHVDVTSTEDIHEFCDALKEKDFDTDLYTCTSKPSESPSKVEQTSTAPWDNHEDPEEAEADVKGLSIGAKIGIAFAVIMFVIFAMTGAIFFLRSHTRKKVVEIVPTVPGTPMVVPKPEKTVVVTRVDDEGVLRAVKLTLNGKEMRDEMKERKEKKLGKGKKDDTEQQGKAEPKRWGEVAREASLRSVSSVGSETRLLPGGRPRSPVSPV